MEYRCTIEKEGDLYVVQFPDMENIATCGFSQEHALEMAKEALDGCLECDLSRGMAIPSPSFEGGFPVSVAGHIALRLERELSLLPA